MYISFTLEWNINQKKIDDVMGLKTYLNKFERINIIQCLLSSHNGIKLEFSSWTLTRKSPNTWRLNNIFLITQRSKQKSPEKLKNIFKWTKWKPQPYQNLWNSVKALLKGKFIVLDIYIRKEYSFCFHHRKLKQNKTISNSKWQKKINNKIWNRKQWNWKGK